MPTGHYGCNCHPFTNWEECDKAHKQKFKSGEIVLHRCIEKKGTIQTDEGKGFYIVKFGNEGVESDYELEHAASLIKI